MTLYRFQENGFTWDASLLGQENGVFAIDAEEALFAVFAAQGSRERDETVFIRWDFLHQHNVKEPRSSSPSPYGYYQ